MKSSILRLGEKVMLPATNKNHQLAPYIVVGHDKGGVYHLVAESRFTEPYRRTIVKLKNPVAAMAKAA